LELFELLKLLEQLLLPSGVEAILKRVADQVERDDGDHDGEPRVGR
jgi:hypothetical protein